MVLTRRPVKTNFSALHVGHLIILYINYTPFSSVPFICIVM